MANEANTAAGRGRRTVSEEYVSRLERIAKAARRYVLEREANDKSTPNSSCKRETDAYVALVKSVRE